MGQFAHNYGDFTFTSAGFKHKLLDRVTCIKNIELSHFISDLHTKLKNARTSDGTTDSIGDIMLNWVCGAFLLICV